jgi:hypothetical protein
MVKTILSHWYVLTLVPVALGAAAAIVTWIGSAINWAAITATTLARSTRDIHYDFAWVAAVATTAAIVFPLFRIVTEPADCWITVPAGMLCMLGWTYPVYAAMRALVPAARTFGRVFTSYL